jgi:hypothetical protein
MDSCCKDHDQCYDRAAAGTTTKKACDSAMCTCLKNNVDPSNYKKTGDEAVLGALLNFACDSLKM